MFFNASLGCIIFLITNSSLLYTAHLLVRRFLPNAPASVRLVTLGTLFYAFIILIFQALSPFYAIGKIWVTISCTLIAMVAHFIWGGLRDFKADIEPLGTWIRDGLNSRWSALLIICGFVVLLSLSRALLMPPLAWDCLTYHLTFASLWIKKGTLLVFRAPDQIQGCAHLPINGEIFASWFLLPFHSDVLVNTMNFPITLLGGISCYAIARELGLTRKEASFAPALICFASVIYIQITTVYVDNAVFAFCSASVLFTLRYLKRGYHYDGFLALIAAGIVFGTKYNGIPLVGLIFIVTVSKMITLFSNSVFFKKAGLIFLALIILGIFGGRQYIFNAIEAGNPLYPLPMTILDHEIFEGWPKLDQEKEWISEHEKESGWDKASLWEREYIKFCYLSRTAGPKFLLFLILALISVFARPHDTSKKCWYFFSIIWIIPIFLYYLDDSANFKRATKWIASSTRYLAPFIALFTIQGLVVIKGFSKYFKKIDFFLVALVAWDIFYVNKSHLQEIAFLYPFFLLMAALIFIVWVFLLKNSGIFLSERKEYFVLNRLPSLFNIITMKRLTYATYFFIFVIGVYFLQNYRDSSRYTYYRSHIDSHNFPRNFVDAWEFLDQPGEKKTIAMAMDYKPAEHRWFFYPLLGRYLQNDIVYISAKYRWEVPTWLDRGLLRGDDFSIWSYNVIRKEVDYILVQKPWPIELKWIKLYEDKFQLMFSNENCKIFKCTGEGA
jgi:hypothetical protein